MAAQNWAQLEVAGKKEEAAGKKEEVAGKEEEATGKEEQAEEGRKCLKMVWDSLQWGWLRFGSQVQSAISCQRDHQQDWQLLALQHWCAVADVSGFQTRVSSAPPWPVAVALPARKSEKQSN